MTEIEQEAEKLLAGITPNPWAWESIAEKSNEFAVGIAFDASGKQLSGRLPEGEWIEDKIIERRELVGMNESGHANFADAEFIAAAPRLVRELLAHLRAVQEERDKWKDAIIDAAIVDWVYTTEHEQNPRKAVNDLCCQAALIALDPAVSEDAAKLVQRAEQAEAERDQLRQQHDTLREALFEMQAGWRAWSSDPSTRHPFGSRDAYLACAQELEAALTQDGGQ